MKIAISCTNPCHLYDLAKEWHQSGALGAFYSGYPSWRLSAPSGFPLQAHSWRTVITYGLLRWPERFRPNNGNLFRWQDRGFDRAVASHLKAEDGELIHAMPGQALETFKAARNLGIETCLNHASGPLRRQYQALCAAARLNGSPAPAEPAEELAWRQEETALADWHCVASSIVRDQLIEDGVPAERIWLSPYGANPDIFQPATKPKRQGKRLVFAGQITARKGLGVLIAALRQLKGLREVTLDCYGVVLADAENDLIEARQDERIRFHGPVSQVQLAEQLRTADLLVLPSWEEAFGLVVPQALGCGIPVVVSDRVGAKDILTPEVNGSVFSAGDATDLAAKIAWWLANPTAFVQPSCGWSQHAASLLKQINERRLNQPSGSP